jgi:saccharopine dehydrogenase (NAD+, L-lysine-forming)
MTGRVLLYGATGFTGRMLAARLARAGIDLMLGGRDPAKLAGVADVVERPFRAFGLDRPAPIEAAVGDVNVVLNAAGPFTETAPAMMDACVRRGVHYLDLAGEWSVFSRAQDLSPAAAAAGVMLMPGVGFTLVASDCLMALAVDRAPGAAFLRVGLSRPLVMSRGTAVAAGRLFEPWALTRRGGALCASPLGERTHEFDFGFGLTEAVAVSMPDVVAGQHSTGIGDIEFYCEAGWVTRLAMRSAALIAPWTERRAWDRVAELASLAWPSDPPAEALESAGFVLVVEATDRWRRKKSVRMRTMDGYSVTAFTAPEIVRRVLSGAVAPGFQTPAGLYGGELILDLGCAYLEP